MKKEKAENFLKEIQKNARIVQKEKNKERIEALKKKVN